MHSSTQMSHAGIIFDADSEFKVRFPRLWLFTFSRDKVWIQPFKVSNSYMHFRQWELIAMKEFASARQFKVDSNPRNKSFVLKMRISSFGTFSRTCVISFIQYEISSWMISSSSFEIWAVWPRPCFTDCHDLPLTIAENKFYIIIGKSWKTHLTSYLKF